MNLSVTLRHVDIMPGMVKDRRTAVIDVLRASTTITTALANGAEKVGVFADLEDARAVRRARPAVLLAGERGGVKPDDFDLGNSPAEFTREEVEGREIAFSSTNGAKAVEAVLGGEPEALCLASVTNLPAAARFLEKAGRVLLVCSGTEGGYSLEDTYCAGRVVSLLRSTGHGPECDEGALAALSVFERFGLNALKVFRMSNHGQTLMEHGFGRDLEFASTAGRVEVVPVFKEKGFRVD